MKGGIETWEDTAPMTPPMTGQDYRDVWLKLTGKGD